MNNNAPNMAVTDTQGQTIAQRTGAQFLEFLNTFYKPRDNAPMAEDDAQEPYYVQTVRDMGLARDGVLHIDFGDVLAHGQGLADAIRTNYYGCESALRGAVRTFVQSVDEAMGEDADGNHAEYYIKFINLPEKEKLRCAHGGCMEDAPGPGLYNTGSGEAQGREAGSPCSPAPVPMSSPCCCCCRSASDTVSISPRPSVCLTPSCCPPPSPILFPPLQGPQGGEDRAPVLLLRHRHAHQRGEPVLPLDHCGQEP